MSDPQYKQALPSGYELRGYRLRKVLGVGGFGVTYLAEHSALGRRVAIKEYLPNEIAVRQGTGVYPKSEADRRDFEWGLARFLDEAKTLARFEHRNLVQVRDYFEANRTAFIVMDYEDGEPLDRLLARHGVLTEIQLRRVLLPIAEGLREVHAAGYLHRDIKPSNVFVRRSDESPVLLDFGAARQALGRKSRSLTAMASEGYSPPEQYESEGEQGPWTDIYALSALCFRAITGNAPIEAPRRLSRIARGQPDPLPMLTETLREGFSQSLLTAVDAGLRIVETKRPASLDEWLARLSTHFSVSSAQSEAAARLSDDASKATTEKGESSAFGTGYRVGKRARRATKRFVGLRAYDQLSRARIWLIGAVVMVAIAAFYTSPFWFGLLAGATGATYVLSLILRGIFLRRVEPPKKQILSTLIAFPVCGIIFAFGAADGGEAKFLEGFTTYGLAGLILMAFQVLGSLTRERKSRENERELPMWGTRKWLIGALALIAAVVLWNYVSNDGTKESGIGNESLPGYLSDTQTPAAQPSPDKPGKLGSEAGASSADGAPERPTTSPMLDATSQAFTIEVEPHAAGVRILNIRPVYEPGMRLPAGNYQVEVSAAGYETAVETVRHETGRATVHRVVLQLPRLPPSGKVAGKLEPGDFELDSGEYADIWIVRAQAGQTLSADLKSREFDAVIYLVDSQGNPIAQDDDSGQDTDARLSLRLDDSGEYPILASSFSEGAVGDYELSIDLSSSPHRSRIIQ